MLRIQVENIVVHSMSSESSRAIAALKSHINIHVYYSNPRLRAWQRKMTNLCSRPPNGYNFLWKYMSPFTPVLFTFSGSVFVNLALRKFYYTEKEGVFYKALLHKKCQQWRIDRVNCFYTTYNSIHRIIEHTVFWFGLSLIVNMMI